MTSQSSLPDADIAFIEQMLARWRADPAAVDAGWRDLFEALDEAPAPGSNGATALDGTDQGMRARAAAILLRRAYRERGHLIADSDPLGLDRQATHPDLDPAGLGLGADLRDLPLEEDALSATSIGELEARLRARYCGTLSAEFMHLDDPEPRDWLASAMETGFGAPPISDKAAILDLLIQAESFEQVMQTKLPTTKRYGMEGSESQMPLCERLLRCAAGAGVREIALGPMHRGRTTFMALFMHKPLAAIFSEFLGVPWHAADLGIAGDVTYHMGHSVDRTVEGATVHISMASHPSHVETVIPVALGKARARQRLGGGPVLGLMMHTDAGFAGQGVVAECFQLAGLEGYDTGGSIHVIANNQVGFTTRTKDARTSRYCSDMGKIVQAPVLRVNGDDPEAAHRAAGIAVEFWRRFERDIIIDLVCYRRQGHNELDEPRYTQPRMYAAIDRLPGVRALYADRLIEEGAVTAEWCEAQAERHWQSFASEFEAAEGYKPNKPAAFERHWVGFRACDLETVEKQPETGVQITTLRELGDAMSRWPAGFKVNARLATQLEARARTVAQGRDIAWATAETLAFASLLVEGVPVRLTGEDTRRGTFSQRHGVLYDQDTEAEHIPLNHLSDGQARIEIYDSPLSEEAVLGFEYGHSLADPTTLVAWEAQFGDFANTAQVLI
ncbi:MAG: thiamine pyrophosphate-dependent enzyme, partial [Hyphomicrobiales bacterium]